MGDPLLDVELPTPLTGQQIFLPFFPTSPPRISPPPAPPILHLQPQTTFVFSVITNTGLEKTLPSPPGGSFVMPNCGSTTKGGGVRQLQWIAPAPSTHHQPATPQTAFTLLPTAGTYCKAGLHREGKWGLALVKLSLDFCFLVFK